MKPDGQKRFQPTLPKAGERSFVVEHPFLVVIIGLLLITVAYLGEEEIACRHGGYKRWDVVVNGEKVWALFKYPLSEKTPLAFNPYNKEPQPVNLSYFRFCNDEYRHDVAISEYRDKQIGALIFTPETTSDRRGFDLRKLSFNDLPIVDEKLDSKFDKWADLTNAKFLQEQAPDWLPQNQLNETSFIGLQGQGYLFRGTKPDQYFWVGF